MFKSKKLALYEQVWDEIQRNVSSGIGKMTIKQNEMWQNCEN